MSYEEYTDLSDLMEEPPGGHNFGRMDGNTLDTDESVTFDWRFRGGFGIAWPGEGGTKGHPGGAVIHPDEYVDTDLLRQMALEEFGFTADQIEKVYSYKGKPNEEQRQLRDEMDSRMLALRRSGANMFQFAEAVGINQRTMNRALVRAEEAEGS